MLSDPAVSQSNPQNWENVFFLLFFFLFLFYYTHTRPCDSNSNPVGGGNVPINCLPTAIKALKRRSVSAVWIPAAQSVADTECVPVLQSQTCRAAAGWWEPSEWLSSEARQSSHCAQMWLSRSLDTDRWDTHVTLSCAEECDAVWWTPTSVTLHCAVMLNYRPEQVCCRFPAVSDLML